MPEKTFFGSRFMVTEKLIFRHVNSRLHVGNLKIQDRYPLNSNQGYPSQETAKGGVTGLQSGNLMGKEQT